MDIDSGVNESLMDLVIFARDLNTTQEVTVPFIVLYERQLPEEVAALLEELNARNEEVVTVDPAITGSTYPVSLSTTTTLSFAFTIPEDLEYRISLDADKAAQLGSFSVDQDHAEVEITTEGPLL